MISSFTQRVPSASRPSSAVSTASFTVAQPAVLGSRRYSPPSTSMRLSPYPSRLTRRIDAVTIWAPLALIESSMTCWLGYPAVPMSRRDVRVTPSRTNASDLVVMVLNLPGTV
jgi:hypothetical protein